MANGHGKIEKISFKDMALLPINFESPSLPFFPGPGVRPPRAAVERGDPADLSPPQVLRRGHRGRRRHHRRHHARPGQGEARVAGGDRDEDGGGL